MKKSKEEEQADKIFERAKKGLGLRDGDLKHQEGELKEKLTPLGVVIFHTIYTTLDDVKEEAKEENDKV